MVRFFCVFALVTFPFSLDAQHAAVPAQITLADFSSLCAPGDWCSSKVSFTPSPWFSEGLPQQTAGRKSRAPC